MRRHSFSLLLLALGSGLSVQAVPGGRPVPHHPPAGGSTVTSGKQLLPGRLWQEAKKKAVQLRKKATYKAFFQAMTEAGVAAEPVAIFLGLQILISLTWAYVFRLDGIHLVSEANRKAPIIDAEYLCRWLGRSLWRSLFGKNAIADGNADAPITYAEYLCKRAGRRLLLTFVYYLVGLPNIFKAWQAKEKIPVLAKLVAPTVWLMRWETLFGNLLYSLGIEGAQCALVYAVSTPGETPFTPELVCFGKICQRGCYYLSETFLADPKCSMFSLKVATALWYSLWAADPSHAYDSRLLPMMLQVLPMAGNLVIQKAVLHGYLPEYHIA